MLLLSRFSHVWLCATPETAADQAPPSLGFSRQEHWRGLPFPSPMHESEKWKWSRSVMSGPQRPHGLQPTMLLHPWDFPGKNIGVGCHCLLQILLLDLLKVFWHWAFNPDELHSAKPAEQSLCLKHQCGASDPVPLWSLLPSASQTVGKLYINKMTSLAVVW